MAILAAITNVIMREMMAMMRTRLYLIGEKSVIRLKQDNQIGKWYSFIITHMSCGYKGVGFYFFTSLLLHEDVGRKEVVPADFLAIQNSIRRLNTETSVRIKAIVFEHLGKLPHRNEVLGLAGNDSVR